MPSRFATASVASSLASSTRSTKSTMSLGIARKHSSSVFSARYAGITTATLRPCSMVLLSVAYRRPGERESLLAVGIAANLLLLGVFKYTDFAVRNLADLTGLPLALPHIVLPLGISFFTFTQIAYLVDVHRGRAKEPSLLNYALFV